MFDLTTGEWLFCSVFAGISTVMYMIHLYNVEAMQKRMEEERAEESFNEFLDFLSTMVKEAHENEEELDGNEEDDNGEKEDNEN